MSRERVRIKLEEQQAARISTDAKSSAMTRETSAVPSGDLSGAQRTVLGLQQTHGNAAVRRLLAAKGAAVQRAVEIKELSVNTNAEPENAADANATPTQAPVDWMIRNHPSIQMPAQMDVTFDGGVAVVADTKLKS